MSVLRKVDDMCIIIKCDKTGALDEYNTSKIHSWKFSKLDFTIFWFLIDRDQDNKLQTKSYRKKHTQGIIGIIIQLIKQNIRK